MRGVIRNMRGFDGVVMGRPGRRVVVLLLLKLVLMERISADGRLGGRAEGGAKVGD